jgi:DNA topoisomerase VI subunit B
MEDEKKGLDVGLSITIIDKPFEPVRVEDLGPGIQESKKPIAILIPGHHHGSVLAVVEAALKMSCEKQIVVVDSANKAIEALDDLHNSFQELIIRDLEEMDRMSRAARDIVHELATIKCQVPHTQAVTPKHIHKRENQARQRFFKGKL